MQYNKENKTEKRIYQQPQIEQIQLDNEISLALESNPMEGPMEGKLINIKTFNSDPFYQNQA